MARLSRRRGSIKFPEGGGGVPVKEFSEFAKATDEALEEQAEAADLEVVVGAEPRNVRAIDPEKARIPTAKRKAKKKATKRKGRGSL